MLKSVYLVTEKNLQISLLEQSLCANFRVNILSPIEAISNTPYLNGHTVLLDLAALTGQDFQQILNLITSRIENVKVALFNADRSQVLQIFYQHQSIRGLFFTDDTFETLVKGIHRLSEGEYWLPENLISHLLESIHVHKKEPTPMDGRSATGINNLTSRENQILKLICTGATNAEIACDIHLSENTVKTHLSNLYRKLGIKNRTQATAWVKYNPTTFPEFPETM